MAVFESDIHQVFAKLLDGKHRILNFDAPTISFSGLKRRIETVTSIPAQLQLLLLNNSRVIYDKQTLSLAQFRGFGPRFFLVVNLLVRLRGGKGGFGSLVRGAAAKAGQKKTNNFDACRDMSGRRLRDVNAEKKLDEWRAETEERKLEKMAEDFIKKTTKEFFVKSGNTTEKYVAKYREDSSKCMEEIERSVRDSVLKELMGSKRKNDGSSSASKRLKIWVGKRTMADSDSESDSDADENDEKSVVIDNGDHQDSSSGSVIGWKLGHCC